MDNVVFILICVFAFVGMGALIYPAIKEKLDDIDKRDWLTKEEAEAFTGENGRYYLEKWKDRSESFFKGWNWAAAFFFVEWLAYRKMYDRSFFMLPGLMVRASRQTCANCHLFLFGVISFF